MGMVGAFGAALDLGTPCTSFDALLAMVLVVEVAAVVVAGGGDRFLMGFTRASVITFSSLSTLTATSSAGASSTFASTMEVSDDLGVGVLVMASFLFGACSASFGLRAEAPEMTIFGDGGIFDLSGTPAGKSCMFSFSPTFHEISLPYALL